MEVIVWANDLRHLGIFTSSLTLPLPTNRFDVKLEHLPHVGRYVGKQCVCPPVTQGVGDNDRPHSARREDRPPWGVSVLKTHTAMYSGNQM